MPFTGREFIDVAASLLAAGNHDEAGERSAISRAYYGAFLHARAYLDAHVRPVHESPGVLGEVQQRMGAFSADIERELRRLHGWRKNADYDVPIPIQDLPRTATRAVDIAGEVVAAIDALPRRLKPVAP